MECVILAGGQGTRLAAELNGLPKCLAPVGTEPFLQHLLNWLEDQGASHVVFSLGYEYQQVIDFINTKGYLFKVSFVIEKEPRGTGGGLKLALHKCKKEKIAVLNGDTYFDCDLPKIFAETPDNILGTVILKEMKDASRYGTVVLNNENDIISFEEKKVKRSGLINGGVYVFNRNHPMLLNLAETSSLEDEVLAPAAANQQLRGVACEGYFIDIGIPEDYAKAQIDLK